MKKWNCHPKMIGHEIACISNLNNTALKLTLVI